MDRELKIFAGRSHQDFATEVCRHLSAPLGQVSFTDFSNENIKVKIEENVREYDVFVIQTS